MADLFSKNRALTIKKFERDKLQAMANMHGNEIKIMELEDQIERCRGDVEAQQKRIEECDFNIQQQKEEMAKEEAGESTTKKAEKGN